MILLCNSICWLNPAFIPPMSFSFYQTVILQVYYGILLKNEVRKRLATELIISRAFKTAIDSRN
jgi:hypothetical protein